jgi:hypothetical protein
MTERPILFSAQMVLALLAGRKTQTRRIVRLGDVRPYAHVGDHLWVRETWRTHERDKDGIDGVLFAADGAFVPIQNTRDAADAWIYDHDNGKHGEKWRPSIFMRRWAARILLEVVNVRVERLQDISNADAIAEGLSCISKDGRLVKYGIADRDGMPGTDDLGWEWQDWNADPRKAYARAWDSINGKRAPWKSNPLVHVVEFKLLSSPTRSQR